MVTPPHGPTDGVVVLGPLVVAAAVPAVAVPAKAARTPATLVMSYKMPTYKLGSRRLHLGVRKHGVSIYGWTRQGDGGFTAAHPELQTSTGTIQLRPAEAVLIADDEFRDLVHAALGSPVPDV